MKKEEAISSLITIKMLFDNSYAREALDIAIDALSEEHKEKTTGISIKNMKMPPNCMECNLCYDMIYCTITGTHMDFVKMDYERLDDCPLEEHNICKGGTND